ncbi:MAG: hypothetical protein Q7U75_16625, partial [Desulfobacterales bacterium]|nr:hypothetical protein [Desulfobacterales bacterium]
KGAAANIGGESLRAAALATEQAGKAGDLEGVMARLPELENQFARLKVDLNEFVDAKHGDAS